MDYPKFIVSNHKEESISLDKFWSYLRENFRIILSVNEKLPVSKLRYFGKYIMQLFGYCYVHVSGQRQADLER